MTPLLRVGLPPDNGPLEAATISASPVHERGTRLRVLSMPKEGNRFAVENLCRAAKPPEYAGSRTGARELDSAVTYRVYSGDMDGLTRSQLAERAQVNLETIRFYEGEGLLPIAPRTASGYRKFSESTVERLAFVKRAKALGFSLQEIRELLHLQSEHVGACADVRDLLRAKVSVVREKRAQLKRLETQLSAALRKCDRALEQQLKSAQACPVLRQMADARPQSDELETNGISRVAARGRERLLTKGTPRMKKEGWRR